MRPSSHSPDLSCMHVAVVLPFLFFSFLFFKKTCCHAVAGTTLVRDWFLYMLKESVSFHVLARANMQMRCDAMQERAYAHKGRQAGM